MRPSSFAAAFIVAAFVVNLPLSAQPPGMTVCTGFNHLTTTTSGGYGLPAARRLGVPFTLATTSNVDGVEWYFILSLISPSLSIGGGSIDIRANDPLTQLPSATTIASATFPAGPAGPNWSGATFAATAVLTPGTWWVTYSRFPLTGSQSLGFQDNPAGPDATPYAVETSGVWTSQTTAHRFKVRLFAANCNATPIPPAALVSVGLGCAGSNGTTSIQSVGGQLPVLGNSTFALALQNGAPNSTSFWFFSASAQAGAAQLGGGCEIHLELTSLFALFSGGFNPVFTLPTDGSGGAIAPIPVPNVLSLGGAVIGIQAAVIDAAAVPGFTTSNALQATIGL